MISASSAWGLGLRLQHAEALLQETQLPCLEIMVEHFAFQSGGPAWNILSQLVGRSPLLLHGLHLDIGGLDPLDTEYLDEVRRLLDFTRAALYSDHLAFAQLDSVQSFDLLPIPFHQQHLRRIADRVQQVQDTLGQRLILENISAYHAYPESTMPELEFLQALADQTGCGILLDVNNLYVNAHNFGFDPYQALRSLDAGTVVQYHYAGHRQRGELLHDTHDQPVIKAVWDLLFTALDRFGLRPLVLERDDEEVTLASLWEERDAGLALYQERNHHA